MNDATDNEYRLGVCGCGKMARSLVRKTAKLGLATIAAIHDPDPNALAERCSEFGAEPNAEIETLVARDDIDAYLVGSPPLAHHANVLALARTGKPIYCEKPLCTTVALCDEMIAACAKSGSKLFVGQVLRLFPLFWRSHEIIEEGALGAAKAISITRSGRSDIFSEGWRASMEQSGGVLLEVNSHELDYLLFLMGPADEVFARGLNLNGWGDCDDALFVEIKFRNGGVGQLHSSQSSPIGEYRVHIQCERGNMVHGGFGGEIRFQSFTDAQASVIRREELNDRPDPYEWELQSFFEWARHDRQPLFTGETGRANVAVAEAAYRSIKSGRPEPVAA